MRLYHSLHWLLVRLGLVSLRRVLATCAASLAIAACGYALLAAGSNSPTIAAEPHESLVADLVDEFFDGIPLKTPRMVERLTWYDDEIRLCQALGPAAPRPICGVECVDCNCGEATWESRRMIAWQQFAQGEYVGHARIEHVPEYRLRVDDKMDFIFRVTREESTKPYQLNVGDEVRVESFTDPQINRDLVIQPDGTITLRLLGQVRATGRTVPQLTTDIDERYRKYYREPSITVTPLKVNTKLEDVRATFDARFGSGGQSRSGRVTPEGTVQLPAVGSIHVQGLTLDEAKQEINERYAQKIDGMEIIPVLTERAPRYVFVVGAVLQPGRFTLEGPTTSMQAIAMAGGWIVGANLRQIVVFRRGDDWRLMATMLDLRGALYAKRPCPSDEIWLNDSDIVVVPRSKMLATDDAINLLFTRGLYAVSPFSTTLNFSHISSL